MDVLTQTGQLLNEEIEYSARIFVASSRDKATISATINGVDAFEVYSLFSCIQLYTARSAV